MAQLKPIVLLDRDGVINQDSDAYVNLSTNGNPFRAVLNQSRRCLKAGFKVFVVTNQSGIARGYYDEATLHAMH